ncbi:MAG TPA: ABC transporter substrate-binding protein, partial [Solirubrobacterales bacterium]|nr:ABC transporter substrate-binding protein [Solirubrobacterales bacterium]
MKIGKGILLVLAVAAAAVALAACGSSSNSTGGSTTGSSSEGNEGGTLVGAYSAFPDYLDPALSHTIEGWTATFDTYIPLLTYAHADGKAGGKVIPGLATALPEVSDGGKTYTMTLRKGLKYSNGEPVVASDFTHSLERVFVLNSSGSPFYEDIVGAAQFMKTKKGGIPGVETDDKSGTVTIHLTHPRGTFENELALPFVALVPSSTPMVDLSAEPPPATGPYMITSSKPGRGWEYERNPQWAKNNAKLLPQLPSGHVDKIKIEVLRNPQTEVNDVESGKLDWMQNEVPSDRLQSVLSKYEGSQIRVEPTVSTYFFWLNTTQEPFTDVKVRQAVQYAINPAAIERIYGGRMKGLQQILPPGMPGYQKLNLYPYDVKKAKELIAEANPSDREITVWSNNEAETKEVSTYYAGVLEEIGFKVELKILSPDNYFAVIGNSSTPDLDTGWASWFEDYPHPNDFFQPLLAEESIAPTNGTNLARFADPALSKKIVELGEEPLGPEQEAGYAQLDKEFMEQAPLAP